MKKYRLRVHKLTHLNKMAQEKQDCAAVLGREKLSNDFKHKNVVSWDKTHLRRGQCNGLPY